MDRHLRPSFGLVPLLLVGLSIQACCDSHPGSGDAGNQPGGPDGALRDVAPDPVPQDASPREPAQDAGQPDAAQPDAGQPELAPATCPGPVGQDARQYHLVFREEFEGTALDRARWNDAIWYESSNPTTNYAVEDGALKIWPQRDAAGRFFNRTIDTDGKYYQTYGYFEIEAKLPAGRGVWPASGSSTTSTRAAPRST